MIETTGAAADGHGRRDVFRDRALKVCPDEPADAILHVRERRATRKG